MGLLWNRVCESFENYKSSIERKESFTQLKKCGKKYIKKKKRFPINDIQIL